MKYHFWASILGVCSLFLAIILFFNIGYTHQQQKSSTALSLSLSTAMQDAANTSTWTLDTETGRLQLCQNIENELSKGLNYTGNVRQIEMMQNIPVIAICDYSGYYLYYMDFVDTNSDGVADTNVRTMTPELPYKFLQVQSGYDVRFTMDKSYVVTDNNTNPPKTYYGKPDKIMSFSDDDNICNMLKFTLDPATEETRIRETVAQYVEKSMETIVQTHMQMSQNVKYEFKFPVENEEQLRSIGKPTVIALYQGPHIYQSNDLGGNANIFSFVSAEIADREQYYVSSSKGESNSALYYHRSDCPYLDNDNVIFKGTISQAANKGASPCPYCMLNKFYRR